MLCLRLMNDKQYNITTNDTADAVLREDGGSVCSDAEVSQLRDLLISLVSVLFGSKVVNLHFS